MNLKRLMVVCAGVLSALAFAAPAQAAQPGFYIAGQFGSLGMSDATMTPASGRPENLTTDNGYVGSLAGGYAFSNNFRAEIELGYATGMNGFIVSGGGGSMTGKHEKNIMRGMVNAYYDIPSKWPVVPYIGAGMGMTRMEWKAHVSNAAGTVNYDVDDDDTVFSYQFIGGVSYALIDNVSLTMDYRWIKTDDASYSAYVNGAYLGENTMNANTQEWRAGVRWGF